MEMNIFEFIQYLRKEDEIKNSVDFLYNCIRSDYSYYKANGGTGYYFDNTDNCRRYKGFKEKHGEDFDKIFQRAYGRFNRWHEIDDLKDRVAFLENQLKKVKINEE